MEIPKALLEKWKALRAYGDPKAIADSMSEAERVTEQTIRNAYKDGECSEPVFKAMAEFYRKRAATVAQYL